jgi:hypothetical protein
MLVVAKRRDHRCLDWCGHDHAGVLADLEQPRDEPGIAGDESGAIAGEVRPLRQRVHREDTFVTVAAHRGRQD